STIVESFTFFCFFFQAEDGIRDRNVTGVQTCALPISCLLDADSTRRWSLILGCGLAIIAPLAANRLAPLRLHLHVPLLLLASAEIGRASCRERVEIAGVVRCRTPVTRTALPANERSNP